MTVNPFVRSDEMLDFTAPKHVEVHVTPEGDRLWVNIDGKCVLRCCQVGEMKVTDGLLTEFYGGEPIQTLGEMLGEPPNK